MERERIKQKFPKRCKRRSTQDMANYYIQNDPEAIFRTTLTGFLLDLIRRRPRQSYKDIFTEVSKNYDKLRTLDGRSYKATIDKALRSALYANKIFSYNADKNYWNIDEQLAKETKEASLSKIEKKRDMYLHKSHAPSEAPPKKREAKVQAKKERNMERINKMINTLGPRLRQVPNIEHVQNAQLKYLRKQSKKPDSDLLEDDRMLGILQCYHFFRPLCLIDLRVTIFIGVGNEFDQVTISKGAFSEMKDEVDRLYEKLFK